MGGLNRITDHKCFDMGEFSVDLVSDLSVDSPTVDIRDYDCACFYAKFPAWAAGVKCDLVVLQDVAGGGSEKEVFRVEDFEPPAVDDLACIEVRANDLDVQNSFVSCKLQVAYASGLGACTVLTGAVGYNARKVPPPCPGSGTQYVFDWENLTPPYIEEQP